MIEIIYFCLYIVHCFFWVRVILFFNLQFSSYNFRICLYLVCHLVSPLLCKIKITKFHFSFPCVGGWGQFFAHLYKGVSQLHAKACMGGGGVKRGLKTACVLNVCPLGPVHLKDEMAFQDEIFRPEGENLT